MKIVGIMLKNIEKMAILHKTVEMGIYGGYNKDELCTYKLYTEIHYYKGVQRK